MKKTALLVVVLCLAVPLSVAAQNPPPVAPPVPGQAPAAGQPPAPGTNPLADYTRQIKYDGLTLSVLLVNNKTAEILFQPPMRYSMRARASQQTLLYIQGTPTKDFDLTNTFTIEQDGESLTGTSTSVKNFATGKVPAGQRIDGIVEFSKKIDISKPFTVHNGPGGSVQFVLTPEALKALVPASPGTPGSR